MDHHWQPQLRLHPQRKLQGLYDAHQQGPGTLELGWGGRRSGQTREMIDVGGVSVTQVCITKEPDCSWEWTWQWGDLEILEIS